MTDFARQLKQFLEQHLDTDLTVDQLTRMFIDEYGLPDLKSMADVDREVAAINDLINESNFQDILAKLGL